MSVGAVAAGSPLTVEAGLTALRNGGNAVDAAVAATLMACVAEPLLTGLGGGGLGIVRMNGQTRICDLFATMPGLASPRREPRPMETIELDFGPTTQRFHVGAASVAVPGLPAGLHALHSEFGRVDLPTLAAPAVQRARQGVPVTPGFERVCELLWPIQQLSAEAREMFGGDKGPLVVGDQFSCPSLGETIERFAVEGASLFAGGEIGQRMVDAVKGGSSLTLQDLEAYEPRFREALRFRYRDATVWVPGLPSVAGLLVLHALRALQARGAMPKPLSAAQVRAVCDAMVRIESARGPDFIRDLLDPGFVRGFLAALTPDAVGNDLDVALRHPGKLGHTTHISVVDGAGNAVGITQSLGETCGLPVPGTGVLLNNFLGEADVNPPGAKLSAGARLMTMCCPTIVELGDQVFVMGSGGSSRIRSAILHGIVYLTDHGMSPEDVVSAARSHVEWGTLHVESEGRPPGAMSALTAAYPSLKRFDGPNMFFGGLHIAGVGPSGFVGGGDRRRSGAYGVVD